MNSIRKQFRLTASAAAVAAASMLSVFAVSPAVAQSGPGFEDPNNWPQYHRTSNAWRFSPLNQINRDNVHRLDVAWMYRAGDADPEEVRLDSCQLWQHLQESVTGHER